MPQLNSEHTDFPTFDFAFHIICSAVACTVCTCRNTIMAFCLVSLVQYHLLCIFCSVLSLRNKSVLI